mmetsp:Transcript_13014/g.27657  ORF Transcript_13014/g.27657 Transcript_13014/m.27657 type:complete len:261 (+) Transcript_13014:301-1083(+)
MFKHWVISSFIMAWLIAAVVSGKVERLDNLSTGSKRALHTPSSGSSGSSGGSGSSSSDSTPRSSHSRSAGSSSSSSSSSTSRTSRSGRSSRSGRNRDTRVRIYVITVEDWNSRDNRWCRRDVNNLISDLQDDSNDDLLDLDHVTFDTVCERRRVRGLRPSSSTSSSTSSSSTSSSRRGRRGSSGSSSSSSSSSNDSDVKVLAFVLPGLRDRGCKNPFEDLYKIIKHDWPESARRDLADLTEIGTRNDCPTVEQLEDLAWP